MAANPPPVRSASAKPAAAAPAPVVATAAPSVPQPSRVVAGNEAPTIKTAEQVAAEMSFFKVAAPIEEKPVVATAAPVIPAGAAATTAPAAGAEPIATDDSALPAYEEPVVASASADAGDGDTFTLPAWVDSVPDALRPEAEKFTRNLYEQTQKLKRQRGEAQEAKTKAEQERATDQAALAEFAKAPTPVAAPELVLSHLRTRAEVDAFVAGVPKQLTDKQQMVANCQQVLKAIEDDGTAPMFGHTYTAANVEAITQQMYEAHDQLGQLHADLAAVPKRIEWLDKRSGPQQEAATRYPDLYKAGTAMAKARTELLKDGPSLDAHPQAPIIIGDHLTMRMVRAGKYKLVLADPKAAPVVKSNAPPNAQGRETAAPLPRTVEGAAAADHAALKQRAAQGDSTAQRELERQFFKVPAPAMAA